ERAAEGVAALAARAVVLLSGGMDSATTAAVAREHGFEVFPLAVRYGQRHAVELDAAARVARAMKLRELRVVDVDLRAIGGSALPAEIAVPKGRAIGGEVPATYVPARNAILLAIALGYAETIDALDLFLGANALDYSGYPDCRPAFLDAFERLANAAPRVATEGRGPVRVRAPPLEIAKAQIARPAAELGVPPPSH